MKGRLAAIALDLVPARAIIGGMDHKAPQYRPYRTDSAIFQIGLKPMAMPELLDFGDDHTAFMAAKRARLAGRPAQFYGAVAESIPAQAELLALLLGNLRQHHADRFRFNGGRVEDVSDGSVHHLDDPDRQPLEVAAGLVEDDLILLDQQGSDVVVTAASNAYSSTRRIVSCVGRSMRFAHEDVPGLNAQLAPRIDRVLAHVQEGHPVVRYNWIVTPGRDRLAPGTLDGDALAQRQAIFSELAARPEAAGDLLWLRSERQKFLRLPQSGQVAFLLHTYSDPLSAIAGDAESLSAIRRLLQEYSAERLRYSGMEQTRDAIIQWAEGLLKGL